MPLAFGCLLRVSAKFVGGVCPQGNEERRPVAMVFLGHLMTANRRERGDSRRLMEGQRDERGVPATQRVA